MLSSLTASLRHNFFPFRFFFNAKNYRENVGHMPKRLLASMSLFTPESAKEEKHTVCSENTNLKTEMRTDRNQCFSTFL